MTIENIVRNKMSLTNGQTYRNIISQRASRKYRGHPGRKLCKLQNTSFTVDVS